MINLLKVNYSQFSQFSLKGAVMETEKALVNDRLRVSKVS